MAPADDLADMCIECGFCESVCPSAGLTLSPRQRIAITRERARLDETGEDDALNTALTDGFYYAGMDTCAACNLCATKCPVGIETGTMIMGKRAEKRSGAATTIANIIANNTGPIEATMRLGAGAQTLARKVISDGVVDSLTGGLNVFSRHTFPKPNRALKPGPGTPSVRPSDTPAPNGKIVYFPACASRMFGAPKTKHDLKPVTEAMITLLQRAGYQPIIPEKLNGQCCGQPFKSKGFPEQAQKTGDKLHKSLAAARGNSDLPMVTDMSTCALHLQNDGIEMADSAQFLLEHVLPHLTITQKLPVIAVHHNCSAQRMDEQPITEALASACADDIAVLKSMSCCGYAGDKGMFQPELNAHALRFAKNDIPENCDLGVSTVTTCATGLTDNLGIPFVGLASVLEYVSRP